MRRFARAIASRSTSMSPMWLASTSTSAASRSALSASLRPRCASKMARKASSGLAKLELVESGIAKTSIVPAGPRQRRLDRGPRDPAKARGDIAIGPQQIRSAAVGVVALAGEPRRVDQAILAADANGAYTFGYVGHVAIAKRQQREARSLADEGLGEEHRIARAVRDRRIRHRRARPRAAVPGIGVRRR